MSLPLDLDPTGPLASGPLAPLSLLKRDAGPPGQAMTRKAPVDQTGQIDVEYLALEAGIPVSRTSLTQAERPGEFGVGSKPIVGVEENAQHAPATASLPRL